MLIPYQNSNVYVQIGAQAFYGWKDFTFSTSMESLVSDSKFSIYDKSGKVISLQSTSFTTGSTIKIFISNPLVGDRTSILDGYIISTDKELSKDTNNFSFVAANKVVDLLDCTIDRVSSFWSNSTFSQIIRDILLPFGILPYFTDLETDPLIQRFAVSSDETAFDAIEKLCRSQAILPLSTYDGNLYFINTNLLTTSKAIGILLQGKNIEKIKEKIDWSERYSSYTVIGQSVSKGRKWTQEMIKSSARAVDTGVTRYRPLLIVAENKATKETMIKRVRWEAQVRAGRSFSYIITVYGWYQRDVTGKPVRLWDKNELVYIKSSKFNLDRILLIVSVTFSLDGKGELTTLELKHPDIFKSQPDVSVNLV